MLALLALRLLKRSSTWRFNSARDWSVSFPGGFPMLVQEHGLLPPLTSTAIGFPSFVIKPVLADRNPRIRILRTFNAVIYPCKYVELRTRFKNPSRLGPVLQRAQSVKLGYTRNL